MLLESFVFFLRSSGPLPGRPLFSYFLLRLPVCSSRAFSSARTVLFHCRILEQWKWRAIAKKTEVGLREFQCFKQQRSYAVSNVPFLITCKYKTHQILLVYSSFLFQLNKVEKHLIGFTITCAGGKTEERKIRNTLKFWINKSGELWVPSPK